MSHESRLTPSRTVYVADGAALGTIRDVDEDGFVATTGDGSRRHRSNTNATDWCGGVRSVAPSATSARCSRRVRTATRRARTATIGRRISTVPTTRTETSTLRSVQNT